MKVKLRLNFIGILILALPLLVNAQEFELGNKLDLKVKADIEVDSVAREYIYSYTMSSSYKSQQDIWRFEIILQDENLVRKIQSPQGWYKPGIKPKGLGVSPQLKNVSIVHWGSPNNARVKPGYSMKGFNIIGSTSLPGIIDYYAEGYHPTPWFPEGSAPNFVSGYHDLTPYGPGVVGKTIGPVEPPVLFNPVNFLNYIISLKQEAFDLGWIVQGKEEDKGKKEDKEKGIMKSLDEKLDKAKKKLEKGDIKEAIEKLKSFIHEVEALYKEDKDEDKDKKDKDKEDHHQEHITSEAYVLLKYNTQYLIEKLGG